MKAEYNLECGTLAAIPLQTSNITDKNSVQVSLFTSSDDVTWVPAILLVLLVDYQNRIDRFFRTESVIYASQVV